MKSRQAAIALASAVVLLPVAGAAASTGTAPHAAAPIPATTATTATTSQAATAVAPATTTGEAVARATVAGSARTVGSATATRPRGTTTHATTAAAPATRSPAPTGSHGASSGPSAPTTRHTEAAHAAAATVPRPRNDSYHAATVVRSLPATFGQDIAGATLDALERGLAQDCGLPTADRAVWFRYDDPEGAGFVVDASGSDHPVAIALLSDPKENVLMGCSGGPVLSASPGPTGPFYVAILSDTAPGTTSLSVRFRTLATAPAAQVSIDPTGTLAADGSATLTGTYSCGSGASGAVSGSLAQGSAHGISLPADLTCDGSTHTWSLVVSGPSALQPGSAEASVDLSACIGSSCSHQHVTRTVTLAARG